MKLAYVMAPGRGDTDLLLAKCAKVLARRRISLCGTVQVNTARAGAGPCDMDVRVLPDGPVLRISQNLGAKARGCRLDTGALETAVGAVMARLSDETDLLIVNKFGKHEADGRGFRDVIAEALARDIPVLVGVNALNHAAFLEFSGAEATRLAPCATQITAWVEGALVNRQELELL